MGDTKKKKVISVSKRTGQIIETFDSGYHAYFAACQEGWEITYQGFLRAVSRKTLCDPCSDVYYRFTNDYKPNESFIGKNNRPVILKSKDSKVCRWFSSLKQCSQQLYLSVNRVRVATCSDSLVLGAYEINYQISAGQHEAIIAE